ncbi:MAG: diguanylate cyclase [Solirubrobacteraceae bacterium]|nr:diguanylate cyclase [Solirubrobacteraceae bacterium]
MGFTAGVLWLVAAVTAGVGALLPGSPSVVPWVFAALEAFVVAYSIGCITGVIPWDRASMRTHAVVTGLLLPLVGLAIWSTGGEVSYLQPLVLFPLLHVAYFFPARMGAPLVAELVAIFAAPIAYSSGDLHAFPARALAFGVTAVVLTTVVRVLKRRLLVAEDRQREMARTDALTGLANRRGFDQALVLALARGDIDRCRRAGDDSPGAVLVLMDLDGFKRVNDSLGHAAGDELLRSVAAHCDAVVRPGDTLARIGGDEFAVVAPDAGAAGAHRLAAALHDAIASAGAEATIAWSVHPDDGLGESDMLRAADRRLYEGKAARPGAPQHVPARA